MKVTLTVKNESILLIETVTSYVYTKCRAILTYPLEANINISVCIHPIS